MGRKGVCCDGFVVFYHSFCSSEISCKEKCVKNLLGRILVVSREKTRGRGRSLFWERGVGERRPRENCIKGCIVFEVPFSGKGGKKRKRKYCCMLAEF